MREHLDVRQVPGEQNRRWFFSDEFDLIVWLNDDQSINGFELCYNKGHNEYSIAWLPGFAHMAVDDGEQRPGKYKASRVLVPDGYFDARRVYSSFATECHTLPKEIAEYVLQTLEKHPNYAIHPQSGTD
jgi:hypothetical protein